MYSFPGRRGPPQATSSSVLCQKCLKKGHYSYECKVAVQDRPYKARPSRSQQLRNPKLAPKLTEDTFSTLQEKKGVADELLAKREAERAKKKRRDEEDLDRDEKRKRRRSASYSTSGSDSDSASSVSSRSKAGRGREPAVPAVSPHRPRELPPTAAAVDRRGRPVSRGSHSPSPSSAGDRSPSPPRRAPARRSPSADATGSKARSTARPSDRPRRSRSPLSGRGAATKDRMTSSDFFGRHETTDTHSNRSRQPDRRRDSRSPDRGVSSRDGYNRGYRQRDGPARDADSQPRVEERPAPRERSLSPFSKRLALTQGRNPGR